MDYEQAKARQKELESKNTSNSNKLKEFDKFGKTSIGLTPDHVKAMPEWKEAKKVVDASFAELRAFNDWFVKQFKKEYAAERRNRLSKN